jgi:hypothetical protein
LIDLVDGLSLRAVVLVSVTNGNLADHDARLGGGAAECLPGHGDQTQAIIATIVLFNLLKPTEKSNQCFFFFFFFFFSFFSHDSWRYHSIKNKIGEVVFSLGEAFGHGRALP